MPKESQNKINARWPIYIGEFHNEEHADIKDDLIKFFSEYEKKFPEGNDEANKKEAALGRATGAENYNLYESKYNLHNEKNEAFKKVLKFISKGFLTMSNNANKNYISKLKMDNPKFNVKITESWFIRYDKGGLVFPHHHGNCSWCCVYYVQIGKDANKKNGSTYFMRPYVTGGKNDFGGFYYASEAAGVVEAEEGKLVIWPNFLHHGSYPYSGEKNRIIISANSKIDLLKN